MALLQLTLLPPLGWRFLPFGAAKIRTVFSRFSVIRKRLRKTAPKKYPTILCNVSKDKSPSIQYYFAKYPCFVFSPSLPLSFPELTRHFSYSQTESVDSEVEVILNLLSLAWELFGGSQQEAIDYRDLANLMAWGISEKMFNLLGRYSKPMR